MEAIFRGKILYSLLTYALVSSRGAVQFTDRDCGCMGGRRRRLTNRAALCLRREGVVLGGISSLLRSSAVISGAIRFARSAVDSHAIAVDSSRRPIQAHSSHALFNAVDF